MVIRDVIKAIKVALEHMDRKYCTLSQIDYSKINVINSFRNYLSKEKYLERPFAYEFYHQLRRLMDRGKVDLGGPIIQAEVNKRYQRCFETWKIPDFIIHIPNSDQNLAVIEFKLTNNLTGIKSDIKKLVEFKTNQDLKYANGVEVILGDKPSLESLRKDINNWNDNGGEEIIIVEFDTDSWKADSSVLQFKG